MKHRLASALLLLMVTLFTRLAPADDLQAPLAALELEEGDCIVFLGDSITHQCLYTQYVEDYFYTRLPDVRLKLHNAGVGGAQAWDALARFDDDVASYEPKYVTILLGMNDGRYQPFNQEIFDRYQQDMTELLERLESIGATPIPMTPTMFDSRAAFARNPDRNRQSATLYNSVLAYYGTWLREVALESGYGFVDMWGPLNNITLRERKSEPGFTMIPDAVHPGTVGQVVMATAIVDNLGLPRQVSNIQLIAGGREPRANARGGELTALDWGENRIEFQWQAESLPWVVPEEAQHGAELTRLGHRLSREALEIHGLAPGRYALSIDGTAVGTYSNVQLARHIELEQNSETPQYRQAMEVAMLNKQRNEGPVRSLRGEWSRFQGFARTRRDAEAQPDNAQLQERLAELTSQIEGMEERVAQHVAAAREIEDQIFEINRPPVRTYVIEHVE
jgi:lysophospholipase L1-like esterase